MKTKKQKITIFLLLSFLFLTFSLFIFAKELEVEYPDVQGLKPQTTETLLPNYVKYIFNSAVALVGLIALGVLIWSGVQYFTSAGSPDVLKSAKNRIKSAFLGIVILLFSYLILITINPQLTVLQLLELSPIQGEPISKSEISPLITTDLLGKIKRIAESISQIPNPIKNIAEKIKELTDKCDCEKTLPLCMCTGGSDDDSCEPRRCYAGLNDHHPCEDFKEIKDNQEKIVEWKDEILYYKNRALAEREDLIVQIEEILNPKIEWYEDAIAKQTEQRLIDYLEEEKQWLEYEKGYKQDNTPNLKDKLKELADAIAEIEEPVNNISQLPDECLVNIEDKCDASCKGKCHDFEDGCQPDKCSGGNPCPTDDIQKQVDEINLLPGKIIGICNEIITIIENIEKTRERTIEI